MTQFYTHLFKNVKDLSPMLWNQLFYTIILNSQIVSNLGNSLHPVNSVFSNSICRVKPWLLTMGSFYPSGKPCSTWTHNETARQLTLLSAFINRTVMESLPLFLDLVYREIESACYQFCNQNESSIVFAITIVTHKSRNLIGALGGSEFGSKYSQIFRVMLWDSVDLRAITKSKEHRETRHSRSYI